MLIVFQYCLCLLATRDIGVFQSLVNNRTLSTRLIRVRPGDAYTELNNARANGVAYHRRRSVFKDTDIFSDVRGRRFGSVLYDTVACTRLVR